MSAGTMLKSKFVLILLLSTLTMAMGTAGAGDRQNTTTINVIGTGSILKGNAVAAREAAIQQSLAAAVQTAVVNQLPLDFSTRHFQSLEEVLYRLPNRYVLKYKVLTESQTETTYRVLVAATVSIGKVKASLSDAGIVSGRTDSPKVLVLISEKRISAPAFQYRWAKNGSQTSILSEDAMIAAMQNRGIVMVAPYGKNAEKTRQLLGATPDIARHDLIRLGRSLNAEVIITGTTLAEIATNTMGGTVRAFRATVTAQAFHVETGKALATATEAAVITHEDASAGEREALKQAGQKAGDILAGKISRVWEGLRSTSFLVEIMVGWRGNRADFIKFRSALKEVPGVEQIKIREMKPNEAVLAVFYRGGAEKLAQSAMRLSFDTFGLNIYEVSEGRMNMELIAN